MTETAIWIIIGAVLFFVVIPLSIFPIILYRILLVRTDDKKWTRACSLPDDEEQVKMHLEGETWANRYSENCIDVEVTSCGFKLVGKYFNFGGNKAVIIIAGRMEGCIYSCYFAEPYRKAGYNVLVIDNRSHGLSEGKYNNVGFLEYQDILKWGEMLHDEYKNEKVICHGICIGSATALYALTSANCPSYFCGLVADGMYTTFRESFKNHLILDKRPTFPMVLQMMLLISLHSGCNAFKDGPILRIKNYDKPILFLYSKEDKFSLPENAKELYAKCTAPKTLVWFDKGAHSHLRVNAVEKYDGEIMKFVEANF